MTVQVALPSPAAFVTAHAGSHPRRRHDRAARGLPPGGHNSRPGGAVLVHPRALPQAVFRLVGGGVGPLQRPDRRHRQLSPHRRLDLAVLAPGGHRVDRPRAALCRAGVLPRAPLARWYLPLVLFPPVWSYVAIYRLDHFLWAVGPAVLFLSLATLWTGWVFLRYRRSVRSSGATLLAVRLPPLGPSPPGLPRPACPRRLDSLGLLHRHPARPRGGHWHSAPRARRPAPRPRGAERSLG